MKTKFLLVAALACFSLSTTAQKQKKVVDRIDTRTVQEFDHQDVTKQFKGHWFLDIQGGVQHTVGEAKFSKLLSPNVQLGLGYQFAPWFGARLQANGWQSKGAWDGHRAKIGDEPFTADYKYKYVAPGIDLLFSLTDLFGGWNPDRVFNIAVFVGGGANIAFSNGEVNDIAATVQNLNDYNLQNLWSGTKVNPFGRAGLQLGFRVSPCVSIMLEGNYNILSDKYNSKKAGNPDMYFNALAGVRINLGKDRTVKTTDVYRDVVVTDTIYKYITIEEPKPQPKPEPKIEPIQRDIFFSINRSVVRKSEVAKLEEIAEYMKKYPKATVMITGYADKKTGSDRVNDPLSRRRAEAVTKMLSEKFGIDRSRITFDSKGSHVQPFNENAKNRVSIVIAEVK